MSDQTLKIAAVTDDGETISRHFGRAKYFVILTVEDGKITDRQQVEKERHEHHHDEHDDHEHGHDNVQLMDAHDHDEHEHGHGDHAAMFAPLQGCDYALARGMGNGAHNNLSAIGVKPILTTIATITDAVNAIVNGTIDHHPEKLH